MRKRVIIADDDPVIIDVVSACLDREKYEVIGVADGEGALAAIRDRLPSLAILDIGMPGRDGLSVLLALKADPQTTALPVMMLTGQRETGIVMRALDAGAADYLIKPIRPARLRDRVGRLTAGEVPAV